MNNVLKWGLSLAGGFIAVLEPTIPFIVICFIAIMFDSFTAYRLSVRIKRKTGKSTAKFQSRKFGKVIESILEVMIVIILAQLIDKKILVMYDGLYLANYVAGMFCFKQAISILENISSCNDAKWAQQLQRVLIDKSERHFDTDLDGDGKIGGKNEQNN